MKRSDDIDLDHQKLMQKEKMESAWIPICYPCKARHPHMYTKIQINSRPDV